MKNHIRISLLLFIVANMGLAQSVNGIPIEEIESNYIQIVGTQKFLSTKVSIEVEFGQQDKTFDFKDTQFMDSDGKSVVFNSMIDALNYFTKYGYEYLDAYALTVGNQNVYHFLLKKKLVIDDNK